MFRGFDDNYSIMAGEEAKEWSRRTAAALLLSHPRVAAHWFRDLKTSEMKMMSANDREDLILALAGDVAARRRLLGGRRSWKVPVTRSMRKINSKVVITARRWLRWIPVSRKDANLWDLRSYRAARRDADGDAY